MRRVCVENSGECQLVSLKVQEQRSTWSRGTSPVQQLLLAKPWDHPVSKAMEQGLSVSYKVLYAKAGAKKRKLFADGFLRFKEGPGCRTAILSTEEGEDVCKVTEKSQTKYTVGSEVTIGAYVVQVDEEITAAAPSTTITAAIPIPGNRPVPARLVTSSTFALPKPTLSTISSGFKKPTMFVAPSRTPGAPAEKHAEPADSFWDQDCLPADELPSPPGGGASSKVSQKQAGVPLKEVTGQPGAFQSSSGPTASTSRVGSSLQRAVQSKGPVEQDLALTRLMRPHQVVGADFLISRLLGQAVETSGDLAGGEESEDSDGHTPPQVPGITCTGAILADEMGVGKTLTSIATIWAFVRRGGRKCLVICPSSLVDNWLKEIKHWLGTKLKPLALRSGADAAAVINTFAISMASLYPVMILSYEMFRKHAVLLNTVPGLELMVCDEGHRLKNIGGTKTMEALSACKAQRRVILSGTPIQNDLDELYAVVSFVAPGFFGSLSSYKSRISGPISRGNESDASAADKDFGSAAAAELRRLLGKIMLRRTQADILSTLLPARHDYVVYCAPTQTQAAAYATVADEVLRSIGVNPAELDSGDEAEEDNRSSLASAAVLAGLQNLRGICNSAAKYASNSNSLLSGSAGVSSGGAFLSARAFDQRKEYLNPQRGSSAGAFSVSTAVRGAGSSAGSGGVSSKLQVLMRFLTVLRKLSPEEKVVIVSNFTSTLDEIEAACGGRWGEALRLDGKVPVDQRQALVNRFNRPDDASFMFLLSAKAGGVGINLIGGSRLIMYDVDWNPAVDHQAMSRIWREGQCREVHIYRFVTAGTVEEAILQRQRSKTDLAEMVEGGDAAVAADDEMCAGLGKNPGERRMSLTRSDVLQLVYPDRHREAGACEEQEENAVVELPDVVLQNVRDELGSGVVRRAQVLD